MQTFKKTIKSFFESSSILRPLLHKILSLRGDRKYRLLQRNCINSILKRNNIDVVLDVGAHAGETGNLFRHRYNFKGKIISFEPIHEKFLVLLEKAKASPPWDCHEIALGNESGTKIFTVFGNAYNSSFLSTYEFLEKECNLGESKKVPVQIRRLEELYETLCSTTDSVLLKIDTQGFEKDVLAGAGKFLNRIKLVKLEVSLVPCYKGETLIGEMIQYMGSNGFVPILIEPGHLSEIHYQLQADIIFLNQKFSSTHRI